MRLVRRLGVTCAAVLLVLVGSTSAPATAAQPDPGPPPDSIGSMGDSITRGFNACGFFLDCPSRSFSTGSSSTVNSHYLQIRAANPEIDGNNVNAGRSGAQADDLPGQAAVLAGEGVDYVTVLIGANDACAGSEASMTPVAEFRGHIDTALGTLQSGLPDARVLVMSIPDIKQLWEVGRTNFLARTFWSVGNICQSMLDNPISMADADTERRDRVRQRVVDYNAELATACAAYGPNCRFDGNAVFDFPFTLDQVSRWDYFHPNTTGQRMLAELTYQAGFGW
ncbi:MAG: SGNH/GDSL hydrolase family protein [Micromonosporaceae bacterium]|nr:SGNH/GDSL hydrolase family protein [Micromonosporaceae bacterium]